MADPYKIAAVNRSFRAERIKDSTGDDVNGVGSVRRLQMGFGSIDEAITVFDVPELIEYRVLKGAPVRNHVGRITFVDIGNGRSRVEMYITFDPIFPGFGGIVRIGLQKAVVTSLSNLARQFQ
jgi:hypothetical protein